MDDEATLPNHHRDWPAFAGPTGLLAALSMTTGRDGDARFASELVDLGADDVVVDIGCGPGAAARHAAGRAASVVGVDPAPVMLRVARALTRAPNARFVEGSAEALPLVDDFANVVWSIATVHDWHDVDDGVREVRRVLRSAGRFVAIERHVAPGATGHASHGWTTEQANAFAGACTQRGFTDATVVGPRTTGRRHLLAVRATAPRDV